MTMIDDIDLRVITALERIATALEQGVLERIEYREGLAGVAKGQVAAFGDPYPAELTPTDEVADLPPVQPAPLADVCPIHHTPWKTVPAGVSKRNGRAYAAFRACSTPGCDQRPRL